MSARWDQHNTRRIAHRLVIEGDLVLKTPARFGAGQAMPGQAKVVDMPLLRDPKEGAPLLTGASIAGALRSYLRDWELGYEKKLPEDGHSLVQLLFGDVLEKDSRESWLVVEDAYGKPPAEFANAETRRVETRQGVSIDPKTRTAGMDEKGRGFLYDYELLVAGTYFPLHLELALPDDNDQQAQLKEALAIALNGFINGEIGMGGHKRRGMGRCQMENWQIMDYDLQTPAGLLAWLEEKPVAILKGASISDQLGVRLPPADDLRRWFSLDASFSLQSSLLIRSSQDQADAPDLVQLQAARQGKQRPILSGTSLAGALRSRALRIAKTVIADQARAEKLVDDIFGTRDIDAKDRRKADVRSSRAVVHEHEIENEYERVQSRVAIDRFTGGSYPGALFDQQPVYGKKGASHVKIEVQLRRPQDDHIGLLLYLLKDLWTGDLPLGGEASVGRGRLVGSKAELTLHSPNPAEAGQWIIEADAQNPGKLHITGKVDCLEKYAQALGGER